MSELKKQIENFIIANRAKGRPLTAKSLMAYSSTLLNLYNQIYGTTEDFDINRFNGYTRI